MVQSLTTVSFNGKVKGVFLIKQTNLLKFSQKFTIKIYY